MKILEILGYVAFLFAAIDFAGQFFDYDLTGVSWSPIAAGIVGTALINISEKLNPKTEEVMETNSDNTTQKEDK